jgi:hypothetical protein
VRKTLVLIATTVLVIALLTTVVSAGITTEDNGWYKLIAGQEFYAGNIKVSIQDDGLHVVYVAAQGYCLNEIHTHAAYTLDGIPQENGNPVPGQFDYKDEELGCAQRAEAILPGEWNELPIYIAAHAVVGMIDDPEWEETGWGLWCGVQNLDLYAFPGDNWAVYIYYTGQYPPGVPGK